MFLKTTRTWRRVELKFGVDFSCDFFSLRGLCDMHPGHMTILKSTDRTIDISRATVLDILHHQGCANRRDCCVETVGFFCSED